MKRALSCILAIAGWYLLYPPVNHDGSPYAQAPLARWEIDSSYGTAVDCNEAHHSDLSAMRSGESDSDSRDDAYNAFLETRSGRCVRSDDTRVAE